MLHYSCPPVLFIIFNRPALTKRVFDRIRAARPEKLFVAADGPRPDNPEDIEKCRIARSLIQVDWDCEIYTLFRESNLGCGLGPASAISWFFENVEEGIILEDDCLPSISFFSFCGELLDYYKSNQNIFAISGTNFVEGFDNNYSFIFSCYGGSWGWATWRRAWLLYDYEMRQWNDPQMRTKILDFLSDREQFEGVKKMFDVGTMDTIWDYQWFFTRLAYGGLSIVPVKNLVSNIGFGEDATHTLLENDQFSRLSVFELEFPLKIDPDVRANRKFDYLYTKKFGYYQETDLIFQAKARFYRLLQRLRGELGER